MATREEEWGNVLSLREKGNLNVVLRDRLMTDAALGGPRPIKSEHSYSLLACSPPPSPATRNSNQHTPNSISIEGFAGSTCISINSNLHSVEHHKTLGLRSRIDGTDIVFHGIYSIVFIFKRLYLFLFAFFFEHFIIRLPLQCFPFYFYQHLPYYPISYFQFFWYFIITYFSYFPHFLWYFSISFFQVSILSIFPIPTLSQIVSLQSFHSILPLPLQFSWSSGPLQLRSFHFTSRILRIIFLIKNIYFFIKRTRMLIV